MGGKELPRNRQMTWQRAEESAEKPHQVFVKNLCDRLISSLKRKS
jgi:hypothetical protein